MYYIYSLIVAFVLFIILQQNDKKPQKTNDTFASIFTFVILYIVCTFAIFLLYNSFTDGISAGNNSNSNKALSLFDMNIVQSIPDTETINTGFRFSD